MVTTKETIETRWLCVCFACDAVRVSREWTGWLTRVGRVGRAKRDPTEGDGSTARMNECVCIGRRFVRW